MDKYLEIKKMFESKEDKENAIAMSKYMRNMFDLQKEKKFIMISLKLKRSQKLSIGNF